MINQKQKLLMNKLKVFRYTQLAIFQCVWIDFGKVNPRSVFIKAIAKNGGIHQLMMVADNPRQTTITECGIYEEKSIVNIR